MLSRRQTGSLPLNGLVRYAGVEGEFQLNGWAKSGKRLINHIFS